MKPHYPQKILPRQNYIVIDDVSTFASLRHIVLLRLYEKGFEDTFVGHYFPTGRFYDGLSTIMLSVFKKRDLRWKVIDKSTQVGNVWQHGDPIILPQRKQLTHLLTREYIGITIREIESFNSDISSLKNPKGDSLTIKDINGNTLIVSHLKFKVKHVPIRCNFWHCEIYAQIVLDDNSKLILDKNQKRVSKSQTERIVQSFMDQIDIEKFVPPKSDLRSHYISKKIYMESKY